MLAGRLAKRQRVRRRLRGLGSSPTPEPWRDARVDQIASICLTPLQLGLTVGLFGILVYAIAKGSIVLPVPVTGD